MKYLQNIRRAVLLECLLLVLCSLFLYGKEKAEPAEAHKLPVTAEGEKKSDYIKWVEFHAPEEIMTQAYKLDVETWKEEVHLDWISLLAYVAAKHGGEFPAGASKEMAEVSEKLRSGEITMEALTEDMKYYPYYQEAYQAVLGGFVGEYEIERADEKGKISWEKCYGLKAFSPIAKGFYYEDYDDFGVSRSYGYARPHLGHDMMGQTGTPIRI